MMLSNTLRQNDSNNNWARNHQIVMFYDFIIFVAMYVFETPPN